MVKHLPSKLEALSCVKTPVMPKKKKKKKRKEIFLKVQN
jgi:hypothetical protein